MLDQKLRKGSGDFHFMQRSVEPDWVVLPFGHPLFSHHNTHTHLQACTHTHVFGQSSIAPTSLYWIFVWLSASAASWHPQARGLERRLCLWCGGKGSSSSTWTQASARVWAWQVLSELDRGCSSAGSAALCNVPTAPLSWCWNLWMKFRRHYVTWVRGRRRAGSLQNQSERAIPRLGDVTCHSHWSVRTILTQITACFQQQHLLPSFLLPWGWKGRPLSLGICV